MSRMRRAIIAAVLTLPVGLVAQRHDPAPLELLDLERAVELAVQGNRQLEIAALDVEKGQQRVAEARTRRLPNFNAYAIESLLLTPIDFMVRTGQFGTFAGVGPVPAVDTKIDTRRQATTYVTGQVTQPLSQLRRIGLAIRAEEAGTELARETLRQTRQGIVDQVKQAYYALLQTQGSLEAAEQSLQFCEELDHVTDRYLVRRVVLKSDSLDVKAQVARVRYQITLLRDGLASQREALNHLMGRDLRTEFRVRAVPAVGGEEMDLDTARAHALSARPEIRQARLKAQQAKLDYRAQAAKYQPDVSVSLNYLSTFNVDFLPKNVVSAGVVVSWEPFDWGRKRHELAEKALAIRQADRGVQEAEQAVLVEVGTRFRKLQQARAFVEVARLALDTQKEKLRVVSNEYPLKAALLKDVLQQQAAAGEASNQYQQALLAVWMARADFERALGGE